jgi:dihydroorotate dehydrogenase (fumarate)
MSTPNLTTISSSSKNSFNIFPPLLNSANPWATTYDDLKALYDCPHTGAVTIRTSLWTEFQQDPKIHQYTFFSPTTGHSTSQIDISLAEGRGDVLSGETSSLNTLGYSPISFLSYMKVLCQMSESGLLDKNPAKPFIVSVTGTVAEVAGACAHLLEMLHHPEQFRWKPDGDYGDLEFMMEVNLSCPNIPDKPPPAYDGEALGGYVRGIAEAMQRAGPAGEGARLRVGIKTPPYTHADQFRTLVGALERSTLLEGGCPISFIVATNTLGSCLVLDEHGGNALGSASGNGIGGLGGEALHPLALGNVRTIRAMLDASQFEQVRSIGIIGVGGVGDASGFRRMRGVGAMAVGVGTALGREGVGVFRKIWDGLNADGREELMKDFWNDEFQR